MGGGGAINKWTVKELRLVSIGSSLPWGLLYIICMHNLYVHCFSFSLFVGMKLQVCSRIGREI